jgi:putative hydrolase of the HAD superfamily
MKIIFDYNRTIFNPDVQALYKGVFDLLSKLSTKHDLYLVSRNEPGRGNTLNELGIDIFFKETLFTDNKDIQIFKKLVGESSDVVVVGDRIKGEILIGNKLNYITVWVKQGKFRLEKPEQEIENPNYIIENISEIGEIIKLYE